MLPPLETKRLLLRRPRLDDHESIYLLGNNPQVMRYITPGRVQTRHEALDDLERRIATSEGQPYGYWIMETKNEGAFVGWVALKKLDNTEEMEVGYRLMEAMWGQGYATEAARRVMAYGFEELDLDRIVGVTMPTNKASARVLEKLGLRYEKTAVFYKTTCIYFAVEREDWSATQL